MVERRLYRCPRCEMIYWGHELGSPHGPFPSQVSAHCPTPGCDGYGLFGQAAPGEAGGCITVVAFPVILAICHWVFKLQWFASGAAAALACFAFFLYMRRRYRPGTETEDQQFAAHQVSAHAEALHQRGDLERAKYGFERAWTLLGRDVEPRLEGAIVGRLANVERELGDFAAARQHYERALQIAQQLNDQSGVINRHNNIGVLLGDDLRDPIGAIGHVQQALDLARTIGNQDRIARMLIHMAKRLREAGRLDEADEHVKEALGVGAILHDDGLLAEALHERACLRMTQHENALAEADLEEALRRLGPCANPKLAAHLRHALATVRAARRAGQHVTVGPPGEQAGGGQLPFDLDPHARKALEQGMEHMQADRLELAIDAIEGALREPHVANDPKASALARSNLGDMLRTLGRNVEAEQVLRHALADAQKASVPFLEQSARLNLGLVLHIRGAWAECRDCLLRALALAEQEGGSRDVGRIHLAIGNLHRDTADYESAERHYTQAESLAKEGGDKELEGAVQQSRGNMYFKQRQWTSAKPCYEEAERIAKQTHDARLQGIAHHMLGNIDRRLGRFEAAREKLQLSLSMAGLCPSEVGRAGRLNDLAVVEQDLGLDGEALKHFQQSIAIYRGKGLASPEIAGCLQNLGVLMVRAGDVTTGCKCILEAAEMDNDMISQAFAIASEDARLEYLGQAQRRLDDVVSMVADGGPCKGDPKTIGACADVVIRRKGVSLETLGIQRDIAASGNHPELARLLKRLREVRMALAQLTLSGRVMQGGTSTPEATMLLDEKRRLEQEAAKEIPDIALAEQLRRADRQAVVAALPRTSVLVEFIRFGFFPYQPLGHRPNLAPDRYAAFVVFAGQPERVEMVDLGDAEVIDQLIVAFRAAILGAPIEDPDRHLSTFPTSSSAVRESQAGQRLRQTLFDPLRTVVGDADRLLFAPDHNLTQVPLEALPLGENECLIDHYRISYLSAARDALRLNQPAPVAASAEPLIIADPDFDLVDRGSDQAVVAASSLRSPLQAIRGGLSFHRLAGTRVEGQRVAEMLGVVPWMGAQAVERRLKACRSPRILHLATHGHFLENSLAHPDSGTWGVGKSGGEAERMSNRLTEVTLTSPLLRCFLALAGANTWLRREKAAAEAEDGLLTAEDAAALDLVHTEMVVLSACDTGRGTVRCGEGVFGLRRAFVLAGARTLVMSLWKVPDDETKQLMVDFYRRLSSGEGRADALRNAQLAMKKEHPHPFFWGAFICQGEFGTLSALNPSVGSRCAEEGSQERDKPD